MKLRSVCCLLVAASWFLLPTDALQCYQIMRVEVFGMVAVDNKTQVNCLGDSSCLQMVSDTTTSLGSTAARGSMKMGMCIPTASCDGMTCDRLKSSGSMGSISQSMTLEKCLMSCCYTDLCNDGSRLGEASTTASIHEITTPSTAASTTSSTTAAETTSSTTVAKMTTVMSQLSTAVVDFTTGQVKESSGAFVETMGSGEEPTVASVYTADDGCGPLRRDAMVGVTQSLTSPHWPRNYSTRVACRWTIFAPPSHVIQLTVESFRTEKCCGRVVVHPIGDASEGAREVLSGSLSPGTQIISRVNAIVLNFTSDSPFSYGAFQLNFTAIASTRVTTTSQPSTVVTSPSCGQDVSASLNPNPITSPGYPNNYPSESSCFWRLIAPPGMQVRLVIDRLNTESCCDYLEVFDSSSSSIAYSVGRFQGNIMNRTIQSTSGFLYLSFISDSSVTKQGFTARYFAVDSPPIQTTTAPTSDNTNSECQIEAVASSEPKVINSPGFPSAYPSSLDCEAIITAPPGMQVRLVVHSLNTEECCDYLQIDSNASSIPIITLKGTVFDRTVESTIGYIRLLFHSDASIVRSGFNASYSAFVAPPSTTTPASTTTTSTCGFDKVATEQPQVITSPGYPNNYPVSFNCEWVISAPPGKQVRVFVPYLQMESCCDYLLFDSNVSSSDIARLAGEIHNMTIVSTQGHLRLRFYSDFSGSYAGFNATFIAYGPEPTSTTASTTTPIPTTTTKGSCGFRANATNTLQPLSFPEGSGYYPSNSDCYWELVAPEGSQVRFLIDEFDTESCCDYLKIYDSFEAENLITKLAGTISSTRRFQSSGGRLYLHFHSDGSVTKKGFKGKFIEINSNTTLKVTSATFCQIERVGITPQRNVTLQSPNFPLNYGSSESCWIVLTAPVGYQIQLDFSYFNTEGCCDGLDLYDSNVASKNSLQLIETLRGELQNNQSSDSGLVKRSRHNYWSLLFSSDSSVTKRGFTGILSAVPATPITDLTFCLDDTIELEPGKEVTLTSPNYPRNYDSNLDCWMVVRTTPGYQISVNFTAFLTESCCDALQVYDSAHKNEPNKLLIVELKGNRGPRLIRSNRNVLAMRFRSDRSNVYSGFSAVLSADVMQNTTTQVANSSIPEVTTTQPTGATATFCGVDSVAITPGNDVTLQSSNYPGYYGSLESCWILLTAPVGYQIQLNFSYFATETCCDGLYLYDTTAAQRNEDKLLQHLRGDLQDSESTGSGLVQRSRHNYLSLLFISDRSTVKRGFTGIISAVPATPSTEFNICLDDTIDLEPGNQVTITSPNYPRNYDSNLVCWTIVRTTPGYQISVNFTAFVTESCCDSMQIYDSTRKSVANQLLIEQLKGNREPVVINSKRNVLALRFWSDGSNTFSGFSAVLSTEIMQNSTTPEGTTSPVPEVTTTQQTATTSPIPELTTTQPIAPCGFRAMATNTSQSLNYPGWSQPYPSKSDCYWLLTAPEGSQIRLTIAQASTDYCCDYLKIYDSSTATNFLERIAGTPMGNRVYQSTNGSLYLHFHSDTYENSDGFIGSFIEVKPTTPQEDPTAVTFCLREEQRFNVTPGRDLILRSQNYPTNHEYGSDCWIVFMAPTGYQIQLNFSYFNTETCCDGIALYDSNRTVRDQNKLMELVRGDLTSIEGAGVLRRSTHNYLSIRFFSNYGVSNRGFTGIVSAVPKTKDFMEVFNICRGGTIELIPGNVFLMRSPNYPLHYDDSLNCWISFRTKPGYRISVNFTDFLTEECCDTLQIFDAATKNDPNPLLIEQLKGGRRASLVKSNSNVLTMKFMSDGSGSLKGFNAILSTERMSNTSTPAQTTTTEITTAQPESISSTTSSTFPGVTSEQLAPCGFRATATNTSQPLNYPGWSRPYPSNSNCYWMLTAPEGSQIRFTLTQAHTESCCDYLNIYDSSTATNLLEKVRGTPTRNHVYQSTTGSLYLHFYSDSSVNKDGFTGNFIEVKPTTDEKVRTTATFCLRGDQRFNVTPGDDVILRSQYYPGDYGHSSDCWIVFTAPTGYQIQLNFSYFNTESCCDGITMYDSNLTIREPNKQVTSLRGDLQGAGRGGLLRRSTYNYLSVRFVSDRGVSRRGFTGIVSAVRAPNFTEDFNICRGGTVELSPGSKARMTSPNYPRNYDNNLICWMSIRTEPGYLISVNFSAFYTESCCDTLQIFDTDTKNDPNPLLIEQLKGNRGAELVRSNRNVMTIKFKSDGSTNYKGFSAVLSTEMMQNTTTPQPTTSTIPQVTTTQLAPCGFRAAATNTSQPLNYPGGSRPYPSNSDCYWELTAPEGSQIRFTITHLYTESCCDYLKVYDSSRADNLMQSVGGRVRSNLVFVSTSGHFYLHFHSDGSLNGNGFTANFIELQSTSPESSSTVTFCEIQDQTVSITPESAVAIRTNNYPSNYDSKSSCWVVFLAPTGYQIQLNFSSFNTESCCDGITLYDTNTSAIDRYRQIEVIRGDLQNSGSAESSLIKRSLHNYLAVHFKSDSFVSRAGFAGTASAVPATSFAEKYNICEIDVLQIQPGTLATITSPNFPENYANNQLCWTVVRTTPGYFISANFTAFDTEQCCDTLQLYDSESKDESNQLLIEQLKGSRGSTLVTSNRNVLAMRFRSDGSTVLAGFNAVLSTEMTQNVTTPMATISPNPEASTTAEIAVNTTVSFCGGDEKTVHITPGRDVTFTSQNYPSNYKPYSICWVIFIAPTGYQIQLNFSYYNTESCCDGIYLYDTNTTIIDSNYQIERMRGDLQNAGSAESGLIRRSPHNYLAVRFTSDSSVSRRGFTGIASAEKTPITTTLPNPDTTPTPTVDVTTTATFCESDQQTVHITPSQDVVLRSQNYPSNYASNSHCWIIFTAPTGYQIQLNFSSFNTESCCDGIYLYDTNTTLIDSDKQIERMRGDLQNSRSAQGGLVKRSIHNYLSIRFTSDSSVSRAGFTGIVSAEMPQNTTPIPRSATNPETTTIADEFVQTTPMDATSTNPESATTAGGGLSCWSMQVVSDKSGTPIQNTTSRVDCTGQSCLLLTATAMIPMGESNNLDVNMAVGMCVPSQACEQQNCSSLVNTIPGIDLLTCDMSCCQTNLCNDARASNSMTLTNAVTYSTVTSATDSKTPDVTTPDVTTVESVTTGVCGIVNLTAIAGTSNTLTSPGFSEGQYPNNAKCTWWIRAPSGYQIDIVFTTFAFEGCCDKLKIYKPANGSSDPNVLLIPTSGPRPRYDNIESNLLKLEFTSDSSVQYAGFSLRYTAVDLHSNGTKPQTVATFCVDDDLVVTPGIDVTVTSNNFPSNYDNSLDCWLVATTSPGYAIKIEFQTFETEACCDGMRLYNSPERREESHRRISQLKGELTDNKKPPVILYSSSNNLAMIFFTDTSVQRKGFNAIISAVRPSEVVTSTSTDSVTNTAETPVAALDHCGFNTDASFNPRLLTTPGYPLNYPSNRRCSWTVRSMRGYQVQLTVYNGSSESCCDRLRIFDGHSTNFPLLATLSGEINSNRTFISTDRHLTITFTTDTFVSGPGFAAYFVLIPSMEVVNSATTQNVTSTTETPAVADCGFNSDASFNPRLLTTPGYPVNYPSNRRCSWTVRSMRGYQVQLTVYSGSSESCCDRLRIFDGHRTNFPLLATISGVITSNLTFISTDRHLTITFTTDTFITGRGFAAYFVLISNEAVEGNVTMSPQPTTTADIDVTTNAEPPIASDDCNKVLLAANVVKYLQSPNYPHFYNPTSDCTYDIRAPSDVLSIRIEIIAFDTESCCDFLNIYDNGLQQRAISGNSVTNEVYISLSSNVRLNFVSDGSEERSGFRIAYSISDAPRTTTVGPTVPACDSVVQAAFTPTLLSSPDWPERYANSLDCRWIIMGREGFTIVFNFTTFETEACCDYLRFTNQNGIEVRRFMGDHSPATFQTNLTKIRLHFKSDGSLQKKGFFGSFKLERDPSISKSQAATASSPRAATTTASSPRAPLSCGETAQAEVIPRPITSPGYPGNYPSMFQCAWTILGRPGFNLRFNFTRFNTERCCDYLAFTSNGNELRRLKGDIGPTQVDIPEIMVELTFKSDLGIQYGGFYGSFYLEPIPPPSSSTTTTTTLSPKPETPGSGPLPCGYNNQIVSDPVVLSSPLYPANYPSDSNCSWTLIAPYPQQVMFNLTSIDLELCCDYLEIYDGVDQRMIATVKTMSDDTETIYRSTDGQLTINFISDSGVEKKGFTGFAQAITEYEVPVDSCGFTTTAIDEWQNLTSPNYPLNYPTKAQCDWLIKARYPIGTIKILVDSLDLELCCDKLTAYDGASPDDGTFIKEVKSTGMIVSTGDSLYLRFTSDSTLTKRGFALRFKQELSTPINETTVEKPRSCHMNIPVIPGVDSLSVASQGTTVCNLGEQCFEVSLNNNPGWFASCMPMSTCSIMTCDMLSRVYSQAPFNFADCKVRCCDTDMCNDRYKKLASNSTLISTQSSVESANNYSIPTNATYIDGGGSISSSGSGLRCYNGTIVTVGQNAIEGGFNRSPPCSTGERCFEASFSTTAGDAWVGSCIPTSICNFMTCGLLQSTLDSSQFNVELNFDNCKLRCCQDNYCNNQFQNIVPMNTTLEEPRYCHNGFEAIVGSDGLREGSRSAGGPCNVGERCFEASFATNAARGMVRTCADEKNCNANDKRRADENGPAWAAQCMPKETCSIMTCNTLPSIFSTPPTSAPLNFTGCKVRCCDEDMCNNRYEDLDAVSPTEVGMESPGVGGNPTSERSCYTGYSIVLEESAIFGSPIRGPPCSDGNACFEASFRTKAGGAWTGLCVPTSVCYIMTCEMLQNTFDSSQIGVPLNFDNCKVRCCQGNYCNNQYSNVVSSEGEGAPIATPATTLTTTLTFSFRSPRNRPAKHKPSRDDVPLFPGCSFREYYEKSWICSTLFFNDYPYSDVGECRTNMDYYQHCIREVVHRCSTGNKPTIGEGTPGFESVGKLMSDSILNMTSLTNPTFETFCVGNNSSFIDELLDNATQGLGAMTGQENPICNIRKLNGGMQEAVTFMRTMLTANSAEQFCGSYDSLISVMIRMYTGVCDFTKLGQNLPMLSGIYDQLQRMMDLIPKLLRRYSDLPKCLALASIERMPTKPPMTSTLPSSTTDANGCFTYNMDLLFLLDGSGSIRHTDFRKMLDFVKKVVNNIDLNKNQVGVIQYSHYSKTKAITDQKYLRTEIVLGQYKTQQQFNAAADSIAHQGFTTYTARAIQKAIQVDLPSSSRYTNPCTRKVIIVITDGRSSDYNLLKTSVDAAKSDGVTFIAIGVRGFSLVELQTIAGPTSNRVITATNFFGLDSQVPVVRDELFNILSTDGTLLGSAP